MSLFHAGGGERSGAEERKRCEKMSEKTSSKWCAKRIIEPLAAYGLNLVGHPSTCVVPIDEDQIIHVAGSLLILQNVDDPSKCMVLPENERFRRILGLCFHKGLQVRIRPLS